MAHKINKCPVSTTAATVFVLEDSWRSSLFGREETNEDEGARALSSVCAYFLGVGVDTFPSAYMHFSSKVFSSRAELLLEAFLKILPF